MVGQDTATVARARAVALTYWVSTGLVTAELLVGGAWDILRLPVVSDVVVKLGYPLYVLAILGVWKWLGAVALLAPRFPRLKEWAYAGVVLADVTAIASHAWMGFGGGEVVVLAVLLVLTFVSWAMRPPGRRLPDAPR